MRNLPDRDKGFGRRLRGRVMGNILPFMQSGSLIVAQLGDSNFMLVSRNRGSNPMLHIFTGKNRLDRVPGTVYLIIQLDILSPPYGVCGFPPDSAKVHLPSVGRPQEPFVLLFYQSLEGAHSTIRRGRTDQGSSPWSRPRQSPGQTSSARPRFHRPQREPGAGSSSRR